MTRQRCNESGGKLPALQDQCPRCGLASRRRRTAAVGAFLAGALLCLAGSAWAFKSVRPAPAPQPQVPPAVREPELTLGALLTMSPAEIGKVDVAAMNLLCAQGLPGAENLDVTQCLRTLDEWARLADRMTQERIGIFQANPEQFKNSENWWRVGALVGVLNRVIGTSYNPALKNVRVFDPFDSTFFRSPKDVFIHGLLTGNRQGTCASMPVLVVSVGRRLGYPLKLVAGANHLFVRWDGAGDRFNVEVTDAFAESKPDDFYHTWPRPNRLPLKSMTPAEELSTFLGFRGLCFMEHQRWRDAEVAFVHAHALVPDSKTNLPYLERLLMAEQYGIPMQPPTSMGPR